MGSRYPFSVQTLPKVPIFTKSQIVTFQLLPEVRILANSPIVTKSPIVTNLLDLVPSIGGDTVPYI